MDWMLFLNIASLLIGVFGVVIGIYGLRKAKTAGEAARVARQALLRQRAAEDLDEMARRADQLSLTVRSRGWNRSAELATVLRSSLSKASGSWSGVIKGFDKDKLEGSGAALKVVLELIPIGANDVEPQKVQEMLVQCDFVIYVVSEIAGRLKYSQETD